MKTTYTEDFPPGTETTGVHQPGFETMNITAPVPNLTGSRLLARNTIWNLLGQLLPMAVGVAAIPPLVRSLGVDEWWRPQRTSTLLRMPLELELSGFCNNLSFLIIVRRLLQ